MEIMLIGRILKDYFMPTNVTKCGGNVLNVASNLVKDINPKSIHLISCIDPSDAFVTNYIESLQINFYNIPTINTPIITYNGNNHVDNVELFQMMDDFKVENLEKYLPEIKKANLIICDLGSPEIINFIIKNNPKAYLIIEPISAYYVKNLTYRMLSHLFLLKGNRKEIETLTNIQISNISDCDVAAERLKVFGVKRAFITLDKDGVYYFDELKQGHLNSKIVTKKEIVGAGDIFLSGVVYALRITQDIEILADYGIRQINKILTKNRY